MRAKSILEKTIGKEKVDQSLFELKLLDTDPTNPIMRPLFKHLNKKKLDRQSRSFRKWGWFLGGWRSVKYIDAAGKKQKTNMLKAETWKKDPITIVHPGYFSGKVLHKTIS